jgi:hypothetical protein
VQKDWESYFALSAAKMEEKFNESKARWCDRNFRNWVSKTGHKIEPLNALKEARI